MTAICPGSFDPITHGHLDVIRRAAGIFGDVIVGVGRNSAKNYLFSLDERVELAAAATADIPGVRVLPLSGLLVDFARSHGAQVIVKGLRFASDFDFELQMAHLNAAVGGIETVMLPASSQWSTLSSTMIREIASFGGDVSAFVPAVVADRIRAVAAPQDKERADG
ncbi:MAG: pantetheine-phosphate adenylyltransferase [Actinobacteria bacterium]|nr:pantetheine-phosphate adenylyltransferase [Actinomycetota bacterium]